MNSIIFATLILSMISEECIKENKQEKKIHLTVQLILGQLMFNRVAIIKI